VVQKHADRGRLHISISSAGKKGHSNLSRGGGGTGESPIKNKNIIIKNDEWNLFPMLRVILFYE
jgi:hypothetical protein